MTIKHKWALALAIALLALCVMGIANAQTASRSLTLTWTLPNTATDGSTLTGPQALTKVQVFLSTTTIPDTSTAAPTVELAAGAVTTTQSFTVPVGGSLFARLKACNSAGCSVFSGEVSKNFPATVPMPPTNLTVTVNITP